jgi:hypothetical protein
MKKLIKHQLGFYQNLVSKGLSIIPIKEITNGHKPNLTSWKSYQEEPIKKDGLQTWYNDFDTVSFGLVTGFNDVEAIDIDSKILPTKKERDEFLKEYFDLLDSHIDDFYKKFCIVKTQSGGFHILYKSKQLTGATKIAKPKGHKEALIESRGKGGFVYIYKVVKGLQYHEIDFISDEDRSLLWQISETYNYQEVIEPKIQKQQTTTQNGISPWEDYANKNTVLSVCGDDFDIVKNGRTSTMIRRKGADSAFSGHIFDNSGKMFLFTTATIYPHEKPLNSFDIYAYKHHNGDYSAATKQAYFDGYGARYLPDKKIVIDVEEQIEIVDNISFPIDIFPKEIQTYILECNSKLNASIDFMSVSFLWLMSVLIGNTLKVQVKNGWIDSPILWISVIGEAGVGKTPDLKLILKPLLDLNSQEIKRYAKKQKEFKAYDKMSKEDKDINATVEAPVKSQLIVDDITMESLVDLHSYNPKSIGVFKDELAGWFKDMNKYREGSDKERFLSAWSGDSIVLNRKTAEDAYVENPFIPILGGIQPSVFKEFQTSENQSNGFLDRMLFCDPKKTATYPKDEEINPELILQYRDVIFKIKEHIDESLTRIDDGIINPYILKLNKEAKIEYKKSHCKLIDFMNSDNELSHHKGMFAKQITYIPRFSLIIEFVNCIFKDKLPEEITKDSIIKATELSDYFISMAKINKSENKEGSKIKSVYDSMSGKPNKEIALKLVELFPKTTKTIISETMDISRSSLYNYLK